MTHRIASLSLLLVVASCNRARSTARPAVRPEAHDAAPPRALASVADASRDEPADAAVAAAPAPASLPEAVPPSAEREEPFDADDIAMRRPMTAVPMPRVPPELDAEARRYRALTNRSMRCWEVDARVSHTPGPECEGIYAQLAAGGVAAAHGVGAYILDDSRMRLFLRERRATQTAARNYDGEPSGGRGDIPQHRGEALPRLRAARRPRGRPVRARRDVDAHLPRLRRLGRGRRDAHLDARARHGDGQ